MIIVFARVYVSDGVYKFEPWGTQFGNAHFKALSIYTL